MPYQTRMLYGPCGKPTGRLERTCQGTWIEFCELHWRQWKGGAPLVVEVPVDPLETEQEVYKRQAREFMREHLVVKCHTCGKPVEPVRQCYAVPTCYACLPPPPPLREDAAP